MLPTAPTRHDCCVPSTGLEPVTSGLKGRRPGPIRRRGRDLGRSAEGTILSSLSGAPPASNGGRARLSGSRSLAIASGRSGVRTHVRFPSHRFRGGPICPLWHPSMCAVAAAIVGPAPAGTAAFALHLSFPAPQGDRGPHGSHVSGEGGIWTHEGLLPAPLSRRARSASPAPLHVLWHRAPPNGDEPSG